MPMQAKIPVTHEDPKDSQLFVERVIDIAALSPLDHIYHGVRDMEWLDRRRRDAQKRRDQFKPGWFAAFFRTAYDLTLVEEDPPSGKPEDVEIPAGHLLVYAPPGVGDIIFDDGELRYRRRGRVLNHVLQLL